MVKKTAESLASVNVLEVRKSALDLAAGKDEKIQILKAAGAK